MDLKDHRTKKVLLIVPSNRGTIALCSLNLYKALQERKDLEVKCVLTQKLEGGYYEFENCEAIVSYNDGMNGSAPVKTKVKWLKRIKKDFEPDISIGTLFGCSTINVLAGGREKKIGIFHSPHQQVKTFFGWKAYIATLFTYMLIYPKLDKLYCVSEEVKCSILKSFFTIKKNKVETVYNIHDIENIRKKGEEEIEEAKLKKKAYFLYCGRLDRNKAPQRLIEAFYESKLYDAGYHIVLMGKDTDNMWPGLSKKAADYGIDGNVHYIGLKNNPYPYMKNAAATVSCSFSEGLPGVLIESLLLGTPIVSTNSSEGVWEIINRDYDYNPGLEDYYIGNKGIISSNLFPLDNSKWKLDVQNLSTALKEVLEIRRDEPFEFEHQIVRENIVNKFVI